MTSTLQKSKIGLICGLCLGLVLASGCRKSNTEQLEKIDYETFKVYVGGPVVRDMHEEITVVGSVQALREAVLYPRVPGKLIENSLQEGDKVSKNETVAIIDRDEVGANYKPAPVPSTISGVVGRMYLDPGENVTTATAIALIVDLSQVRVKANLPERYLGAIQKGQEALVKVEAYPGESFKGSLYKVSPVVDPATRTIPIEFIIDNKDTRLKSGMFAEVGIVTSKAKDVLTVPLGAISSPDEKGQHFVFVLDTNDQKIVRKIPVETGIRNKEVIEITKGLRKDQTVVIDGLYGLKDGSQIQVVNK